MERVKGEEVKRVKGKRRRGAERCVDDRRKKIESFEDLFVWQQGIALVKEIYAVTDRDGFRRDFGLRDQMRRAAVSAPTNVAEGFERYSRKEYVHFLHIAKGSIGELRSLLRVALEIGYLQPDEHDTLHQKTKFLSSSIANQIKSIGMNAR